MRDQEGARWAVRRLAVGRALSSTGGGIAGIALAFLVYTHTGSAIWLATTLFFTFGVTGLLQPFAGALADRLDRRRIMIVCDLLSAACWTVLVFVRQPVVLVGLGFLASVVALPFGPASTAAVPNIAGEEDLVWANGLLSAAGRLGNVLGPVLGGALYAIGGARLPFAVNAVSFLVSAGFSSSVHLAFSTERQPGEELGGALRGFAAAWDDRVLRALLVSWTLMFLAMDVAFVADPPLARSFGLGSLGYGLIDTFFGIGGLAGSLLARRVRDGAEMRWVVLGEIGVVLGWLAIAAARWFPIVLAASIVVALLDGIGTVAGIGLVQRRTADRVRGRVFAAVMSAGFVANAVGFAMAGPLEEAFGWRAVYATGSAFAAIATASLLLLAARAEPAAARLPVAE